MEFQNKELYKFKYELASKFLAESKNIQVSNHALVINFHGIILNFVSDLENDIDLLKDFFPKDWHLNKSNEQTINISFQRALTKENSHIIWDDEPYSECISENINEKLVCFQRDFLAIERDSLNYHVYLLDFIDDGFYNFLRWLLPRKLPLSNKVLLHSSCIVKRNGKAVIFLGHSGAGKTTIAGLAGDRLCLGDDMNLFSWKDESTEGFYISPGAVGGAITCEDNLSVRYPIEAIYWLHQAEENKVEPMESVQAAQKFISSCANLYWESAPTELVDSLFACALKVSNKIPFYNLYFKKNAEIWNELDNN
ncbi:MAG: hypothetical protein GY909_03245 [Oligoflexia bacterium]|nr:hypothetical protein [Oligoflexia bacterium]